MAKRATAWTWLALAIDNGKVLGTCFAECRGVSFQTLSVGVAGDVQVDAAVCTAAMNSCCGLLAAGGEFDAVWNWSPVPWEGMNFS